MTALIKFIGALTFWGFIAVKLAGHIFAAWSWWWLLMPFVPWIGYAVQRMGL